MTREELFNNLKGGARWDVGVSINRSNSLPLDAHSLFQTYEAAEAYASKDASKIAAVNTKLGINLLNNAYIGQILAVVEDKTVGEGESAQTVTTVGLYYIDAALKLQPVGKEVVADEKTIINDNGTIKLYGFEAAAAATYPRKKADGTLEWVTVQELVEGATENTITVGDDKVIVNEETDTGYRLTLHNYDTASLNQVPVKTTDGLTWIDVYSKREIDTKIAGIFVFKGTADELLDNGANLKVGDTTISASDANVGHVYVIGAAEYVSNGTNWEPLGSLISVDLSNYYTKAQTDAAIDADVLVETNRATQAEDSLATRIKAIEDLKIAENYVDFAYYNERDRMLNDSISSADNKATEVSIIVQGADKKSGLVKDVADLKTLTSTHSTTLETLRTDVDAKVSQETYNTYISDKSMSDIQLKEYADGKASEVDGKVTTLSGKVTTAEGKITTLEGKVSALEGATSDIATIRSDVSTNKTDIASIKTTLNGTDGASGLVKRVSDLETDNTATKGDVSTLKAQLTGIKSDETVLSLINDAKKAGTDAQSTANDAVAGVNTNAGNITRLSNRLDSIDGPDGILAGHEVRLNAIDGDNGAIATINGQVSAIDGRVTTVEGKVSTLEGQITGLTGAMHFRGVASQDPTVEVEGVQQGPAIEGISTYAAGDVVIYSGKEYVYDGSAWHLFGDEGSYALKDSVYTKTEVDGHIATLNQLIGSAKQAAVEEAAGDATSKANKALEDAKAYADALMSWTEME